MKALPPSLYQITSELAELENALENDIQSTLLAEDPEIMKKLIIQIQEKADSVVGFQNYMEDQIAAVETRVKEMNLYKIQVANKLERLDQYVAACLKQLGTPKIEGKLSTISRRAPTDIVIITDESQLPMEYLRTKVEAEKVKIKAALKNGVEVPGAVLEKSQNISITYKNRKALTRKEATTQDGEGEA